MQTKHGRYIVEYWHGEGHGWVLGIGKGFGSDTAAKGAARRLLARIGAPLIARIWAADVNGAPMIPLGEKYKPVTIIEKSP